MGERLYYVSAGGEPGRGPLSESAVRRELEAGTLPRDALVCEVGSTERRSVASLDSPDAPAPAGPLPPPPPPVPPGRPAPPPRTSGSGRVVLLVIAVVAALALAGARLTDA